MISDNEICRQLRAELFPALLALSVSTSLLYLNLYVFAQGKRGTFVLLSIPIVIGIWSIPLVAPVGCAALQALLYFAVAVSTMKILDIMVLSMTDSFPHYTRGPRPTPAALAWTLLTELRYESFTPNPIRGPLLHRHPFASSPRAREIFYSEPFQYLVHFALFILLQCLPQYLPVKALGVLCTIWLIWTTIQLIVRYPESPPLFGPLFLADSLATFWTETWHNVFASPCYSLAYKPTMQMLTRLRVPASFARPLAVVAAFVLMAGFHMYALTPVLTVEGRRRIGVFFVANSVLVVAEVGVWGKKRHWMKAVLAWAAELSLASWTVEAVDLPDGILAANWQGLCNRRTDA